MAHRLLACSALVALLTIAACGSGSDETPRPGGGTPAGVRATFDPSKVTATVSGKAVFEGSRPTPEPIRMSTDPYCTSRSRDALSQDAVVNPDGTLRNVIVYVKSGLPRMSYSPPAEPVTIDQKDCVYSPHVFTLSTSQSLRIVNSDATMHNIHAWAERNPPFNIGQPLQGMETIRTFERPEIPVAIRCDVHQWMNAYVGVFEHPFHTVTRDNGTFEMKLLPGSYDIEAWHPTYAAITQKVDVAEDGKAEITFTFSR